jgi:signal peptidase I
MKKLKIFGLPFILIFILFNFKVIKIQGNSMDPIIKNNSYAIVDNFLHKLFTIQKNDILLFESNGHEVVKKIVGFPGETIEIETKTIKLDNNEIYVIGENPKESIDSRTYGPLKKSQIIGKIVLVF